MNPVRDIGASKKIDKISNGVNTIIERIRREIAYYSPPKDTWTLKAVGAFWDSIFDYDDINKQTDSYGRRFTDSIKLSRLPNKSYVLDICSRTGNGSIYYYKNNKISKVVCADVSERFLRVCHERLTQEKINHEMCLFDTYQLPFKDKQFDGILCFETIEHVAQPEIFLKEMHRLLKDEGELILTTPNVLWEFATWLCAVLNLHHSEGPHKFIRRKRLLSIIRLSGYKIEREKSCVLIPGGPQFLLKLGEKLEGLLGESIMRIIALRRIFILQCRKVQ